MSRGTNTDDILLVGTELSTSNFHPFIKVLISTVCAQPLQQTHDTCCNESKTSTPTFDPNPHNLIVEDRPKQFAYPGKKRRLNGGTQSDIFGIVARWVDFVDAKQRYILK